MKNGIGIGISVAMAIVASVSLLAQDATSSTGTRAANPNAISVTGCVQKAEPGVSGDTSQRFVLTNVMRTGAPSPTGTAGGSRAASGPTYPIDADESKLAPHIGHQVEVSGTFQASTPAPGVAGVPKLKVDSLRMLGASCAQ